jgi:hypothetical protein
LGSSVVACVAKFFWLFSRTIRTLILNKYLKTSVAEPDFYKFLKPSVAEPDIYFCSFPDHPCINIRNVGLVKMFKTSVAAPEPHHYSGCSEGPLAPGSIRQNSAMCIHNLLWLIPAVFLRNWLRLLKCKVPVLFSESYR